MRVPKQTERILIMPPHCLRRKALQSRHLLACRWKMRRCCHNLLECIGIRCQQMYIVKLYNVGTLVEYSFFPKDQFCGLSGSSGPSQSLSSCFLVVSGILSILFSRSCIHSPKTPLSTFPVCELEGIMPGSCCRVLFCGDIMFGYFD